MRQVEKRNVLLIGPLPIVGDVIGGAKVSFAGLTERCQNSEAIQPTIINISRPLRNKNRFFRAFLNVTAFFKICIQIFLLTPRHHVVMFNASVKGAIDAGPIIYLIVQVIWRRPLIVRFFGGNLDLAFDELGPLRRWLFRNTVLGSRRVLLQTKRLCRRFDAPNVEWFPTTRNVSNVEPKAIKSCKKFVMLSQIRHEKGVFLALEAIRALPNDCRLDLYGSVVPGTDTTAFENQLNVQFHGRIAPEDVKDILVASDALLLPTFYLGEGMPGVIVEAFQCGIPVIASNWRDISELVVDGDSGLLVEAGSATKLRDAMLRLNADEKLYERLCEGASTRGREFQSAVWQQRLEVWISNLVEN